MILAATYGSVTNDVVVLVLGLLAILAQVFVIGTALLALVAFVFKNAGAKRVFDTFAGHMSGIAIPLAFIVAATSMAGSLYFSLVIGWLPCNMCWYQRTMIYPLAVILGVATVMRRMTVIPYAIALAAVCVPFSVYHYLLEWFPQLETSVCDLSNPCSQVFLRLFGYLSIPLMALTCVTTVITLLLVQLRANRLETESSDQEI